MKRTDISRLRKNRAIYLKLGFIVALSMVIGAFSYTQYQYENFAPIVSYLNDYEDVAIIRTPAEQPRKLPPTAIRVSENILLEETAELTEEIEPIVLETNIDRAVTTTVATPSMHFIVKKAVPAPPPPPAVPEEEDIPFVIVEKMPLFGNCAEINNSKSEQKSCSDKALIIYLMNHVRYPALARENNIQGTAVIRFVINKDGKVTDAEIVRDLAGGCGAEALRVIKNMPDWMPGQQRARKVEVQMTLPVKFALR